MKSNCRWIDIMMMMMMMEKQINNDNVFYRFFSLRFTWIRPIIYYYSSSLESESCVCVCVFVRLKEFLFKKEKYTHWIHVSFLYGLFILNPMILLLIFFSFFLFFSIYSLLLKLNIVCVCYDDDYKLNQTFEIKIWLQKMVVCFFSSSSSSLLLLMSMFHSLWS